MTDIVVLLLLGAVWATALEYPWHNCVLRCTTLVVLTAITALAVVAFAVEVG